LAPHLTLQQLARKLRREGRTTREIVVAIGCSRSRVRNILHDRGYPHGRLSRSLVWSPGPPRLSLVEREEISRGMSVGEPVRSIARRLGPGKSDPPSRPKPPGSH
jgi:hypothetical protein